MRKNNRRNAEELRKQAKIRQIASQHYGGTFKKVCFYALVDAVTFTKADKSETEMKTYVVGHSERKDEVLAMVDGWIETAVAVGMIKSASLVGMYPLQN